MLVDINLTPKKEKKNATPFLVYTFMSLLTLFIVGFGGLMYWSNAEEIKNIENQIEHQNQMNLVMKSELEGSSEEKQAKQIQEFTQQIRKNSEPVSNVMNDITRIMPSKAELNSFEMNRQQIDLNITSSSNEEAVMFYKELQGVESFVEVNIHTISFVESENKFVTNYTVHLQQEREEGDES